MIGAERIMIGFPSAGGERVDGVVNYFIGNGIIRLFQTTTFGEYNGKKSQRAKRLIKDFNNAGIPSVYCSNMDAWQKYHVSIVTCIANILYKYNGNNYELSKSSEDITLMIQGIKEGFSVLRSLGYSVTPMKLNYFKLPSVLLLHIFKPLMSRELAKLTMSKHAMVAVEEMKCLQDEFDLLIAKSGIKTQAIDILKSYLYSQYNKSK
jgi:2-dehydropantoate 2-reductase